MQLIITLLGSSPKEAENLGHQNFPEENNNIADHIYSRDFLVLVQTIVKVLHAFQDTLKYLISRN